MTVSVNGGPAHLPRIVVHGDARTRGQQYGQQARTQILRSVAAYQDVFARYAGLDWEAVLAKATGFIPAIEDFAPTAAAEMRGIAEAAGLRFEEVVALNVRSEMMFAGGAPTDDGIVGALASECAAFAAMPETTSTGNGYIGQNWDWLVHSRDTVVLVEAHREDGPDYITVVEAGLLAKTGFNSAGLAVCTNTLVSDLDTGRLGVPYHVLLRSLLDCESITDGVAMVYSADKALSANYLLGSRDGLAVDLETIPGAVKSVRVLMPEAGFLAHTNHFLAPDFARLDRYLAESPHTLFRLDRLRAGLAAAAGSIDVGVLETVLADHRNAPYGLCSHGDDQLGAVESYATIASVVYDLAAGVAHVAAGLPCSTGYLPYHSAVNGHHFADQERVAGPPAAPTVNTTLGME